MTFTQIESRFYLLTGLTAGDVSDANLNIYIGEAYRSAISKVMQADSKWQYDDSNQTDLPIGTTQLNANQQDYSLAVSHLSIERVEVKDTSGNWIRLNQIDQQDFKRDNDQSLTDYQSTAGTPREYDLIGSSIFLYPKPNYTQAASLKIYFTREPLMFDYTDDKFSDDTGSASSVPGFNSLYHDLIPLYAAYDYFLNKIPEKAVSIRERIRTLEDSLVEAYSQRNKDRRKMMSVSNDSNR